jgi:rRNA-processing protein FCF1
LTIKEAKRIVKESCKHTGGCIDADECIKNYIDKKNESKMFVCTNDEELRNHLRNLGTVPVFFFKYGVLVMDSPTEITEEKHRMVNFTQPAISNPFSHIERIIKE